MPKKLMDLEWKKKISTGSCFLISDLITNNMGGKMKKKQSQFKPWVQAPWVRCYCPVGMNGDDRWAGRGWGGWGEVGRRLSDSSREVEGSRMGVGGPEAGRTRRHAPSSLDLWRAKALTRLSHRGGELRDSTSGMSIGERETLSMWTASHTTTDMSAISGSIIDKSPTV